MAQTVTLPGLRAQIIKSLYGRKLGFASGNADDDNDAQFLTGIKGLRLPVTAVTTSSTAADQIPAYGYVTLACGTTTGTTYHTPVAPVPGHEVNVYNISTGTHTIVVTGNGGSGAAAFIAAGTSVAGGSTAGTAFTIGPRGWASLTGMTTALWYLKLNAGSTVTTGSSVSSY